MNHDAKGNYYGSMGRGNTPPNGPNALPNGPSGSNGYASQAPSISPTPGPPSGPSSVSGSVPGSGPAYPLAHTDSHTSHNSHNSQTSQTSHNSQEERPSDPPKKKRRATVRACDACAIRKVKCDTQRPCGHCVANDLNCTQLRERKKSGPKNLHKKTLASINSLSDKTVITDANRRFDANHSHHPESSIIASNRKDHPIEMLPDSLSGVVPSDDTSKPHESHQKVTFPYAQNNNSTLSNVSDASASSLRPKTSRHHSNSSSGSISDTKITTNNLVDILSMVKEPVISSILKEITVKSLINNCDKLIEFIHKNINNVSIDLILNSNDPVYLSKILVILSLALIIVENITQLIYLEADYNFLSNFNLNYFNTFRQALNYKIVDTFQLIDKILLYPYKKFNYFQIYYNQSIGCIHLFNYYNITRPDHHDQIFVNQQRIMHLRKSISYYQMINLNESGNKNDLSNFQLNELFEKLFLLERYNYLVSPNLINSTNLFDLNLSINSNHPLFKSFKLINNDDMIFHKLKSYNVLMNLYQLYKINHYPDVNNLMTKPYLNLKIGLLNTSKDNLFYSILTQILIFKVLMIYSNNLELSFLESELIELVNNLNKLMNFNDALYLKFINFKVLVQLVQILKINIDFENNLDYLNELIIYTKKLWEIFPSLKLADNKLINSNKIVFDWFEEMKKIDSNELFRRPPCTHSQSLSLTKTYRLESPEGQPGQSGPVQSGWSGYYPTSLPTSGPSSLPSNIQRPPSLPAPHKNAMPPPQSISGHNQNGPSQGQDGPFPQQLHHQLNKLQQSQINLQQINSNSTDQPKDKAELNDLLQNFGNSKLSSNNSTSASSAMVTTSSSPEPSQREPANPSSSLSQRQQNQQILQNSNSTSYSTIIQNGVPAPPVITPATATNNINGPNANSASGSNIRRDDENPLNLNISESTKNLYNLFTQINDDVSQSRNNSLTNLFQFNNSSNNLNKISSLSNLRSSNNLALINSNSTLNLFMSSNPNFNPPNTNPNSSGSGSIHTNNTANANAAASITSNPASSVQTTNTTASNQEDDKKELSNLFLL